MLARRTAVGASGGFLALTVATRLQLLGGWDMAVRDAARRGHVWGAAQIRADYIVEAFRPPIAAGVLAALVIVVCLVRRSLRPAVLAAGAGLAAVAATLAVKAVIGRPDPHGTVQSGSGSFPSGHTVSLVLCVGLAVCLLRRGRSRWQWLIPGLAGLTMGTALVIEAAHWASDVLGGALLATAVLSTASATGLSRWSAGPAASRTASENDPRGPDGSRVSRPAQ